MGISLRRTVATFRRPPPFRPAGPRSCCTAWPAPPSGTRYAHVASPGWISYLVTETG